ncbi:MAG TPA: response regulator [Pyrinomonadaceae bacterium]|nr:response regulator [Pyrinomonadaceae bacterium]
MDRPILIIEDDPDIAEVLRYGLEARHFETRVAATGNEGLSASLDKERPPLLILLDQLLPGMNGLDICRRIRREPSIADVPIIMVTAKASETDFLDAKAAGVDDYVTKPFSVTRVMERVEFLLESLEAGRTLKLL